MNTISGIDVSSYNGYIDWKSVAESGIRFVMVKATQGRSIYMTKPLYLFTDSRYAENTDNAYAAGVSVGVYHYLTAKNAAEALEEADYFISVISKKREKISLWAAVDVEEESAFGNLSRDELSDIVLAFCGRVSEAGFRPMMYTNRNYLKYKLNYERLRDIDVWQAHWSSVKPVDVGERLKIWQYGFGSVAGIPGGSDLNNGYFHVPSVYERGVVERCGLLQITADYINAYTYAEDLWRKLYEAMDFES